MTSKPKNAKANMRPSSVGGKPKSTLSLFTTRELLKELTSRLKERPTGGQTNTDWVEYKHRLAELEHVNRIEDKGRNKTNINYAMSTEERLAEKMWWWLSDNAHEDNANWAETWLEHHPAKSVGTQNLSYREKWLKKTLKKIPSGNKILDAGAGELQYKRFCEHLDYVSQDFGQYNGEGDTSGLQMGTWDNSKLDIISDIGTIPVKDKSFDAIMCIEVFEHIPRPIDAVKEFSRILKPGGKLVLTTPFCALTHFAPYFFYNGYSRYFFETILPEYGFEIQEIDYNGNYFEYLAQEIRRLDEVANKYAAKTPPPTPMDEMIKRWLLRRLEAMSETDTGSSELLVQGIHVVATKK